ncbi:glycosyltransferase family 9 protein [bacterium]|nr:glycosyltransferase family 9 protein [bacterium]MBU1782256.1 glycosyltransferase family 9 protein [bacterium]
MKLRLDCRYLIGEKPCKYKSLCEDCSNYKPMGKRLLIIKLGAMGDVLRTTPLLKLLREKYDPGHITWVSDKASFQLLKENPLIDKLYILDLNTILRLQVEEFDILYCLDKDTGATSLASLVKSKEKLGYGLEAHGNIYPLNKEAEYSFQLGINDPLKFKKNKQSYQEFIFEAIGLKFQGEEYILPVSDEDLKYGQNLIKSKEIKEGDLVIGLNTGCGPIFATKKWTLEGYVTLANKLHRELKAKVLLLGGPEEVERNSQIKSLVDFPIIDTGCDNTLMQFAGIVNSCHLIITGDSIAMHFAIALKRLVLAIFGSTCAQEVYFYNRGKAMVPDLECAPCYRKICLDAPASAKCMQLITVEEVYQEIVGLLKEHNLI